MFRFDKDVAIQVILYIANRIENPTFHSISKITYFADKLHLERYGRFICGDDYVAMKHGPVPSGIYDILKYVRDNKNVSPEIVASFNIVKYNIKPFIEADLDYLSESDVECLDEAIEVYGSKTFQELTNLSHDGAWQAANENDFIEIEDIVKTFENYEDLLEHLGDPHPE